ncbi:putative helicase [Hyphodiscus hymeniophilus]|uniref:Helicase n=1 Tax=Hyphodiscus hymeniophilus TaxID=353542 RepID=A0A9P7B0Z3_9HELO|nr:putative helicase [Hyphodiscus hymeniophilus]
MATAIEEVTVGGTSSITGWYDAGRPMWIDLVGDYAGRELFLVEGDSLLRECFEDERIDFDVYVVERFLENLVKRHCQFHLAFFEGESLLASPLKPVLSYLPENAELCIPPGSLPKHRCRYLLARAAIKSHLTIHLPEALPSVAVNSFPSLESAEFKDYLHVSPVHFVMAHDGANKNTDTVISESDKCAKVLLRGMIWYFNIHKLNVALINQIEFRDSKVFTMIVESFTPKAVRKLSMTSMFTAEIKENKKLLKDIQKRDGRAGDYPLGDVDFKKHLDIFHDQDLGESSILAAYAVSLMLKQGDCDTFLASAFMLHGLVARFIPLAQRRLPLISFDADFEEVVDKFLTRFSSIAIQVLEDPKWNEAIDEVEQDRDDMVAERDTMDLVDGRLLRAVMQAMCEKRVSTLPGIARDDWSNIMRIVKQLSGQTLSLDGSVEPESTHSTAIKSDYILESEELSVLPFSSPVFDQHLKCIHVDTDDSVEYRMKALKLYRETSHWHNHRKPLVVKAPTVQVVSKWRNPLRTNQFYMKEMTSYAASLTGATGKALDAETITVGPKRLVKLLEEDSSKTDKPEKISSKVKKDEKENKNSASSKKGTKKAASGLSKKEQMIADNKERKGSTESDKVFSAWITVMKDLETITDDQDRYLRTVAYLNSLDSTKSGYLETEVDLYIVQSLLNWWATYCKTNKKAEGYHVVALIWTTIRSICTSKSLVTKDIALHVTKVCNLLGINDALTTLVASADRKLSFTFKYPQVQSLIIDITQIELQLDHCGPYMDRMLDAKPDARVSGFVPDGWQRDVLDQLDANNSVFVVAPTSAGKTFISFYAMEQILRADNDSVLVYVAPTKALVNQIAAEVQGRFSKKFPQAGKGVWAIHTRDYRVNNPTGCQILVTVPHILQIMLLSPSNAKSWAPRVKRIIFDEIHSIGQAEDGVVWEQLLLLAPCPIIALSATVGNPEQFNDWLKDTQKSSGSELKMIKHSTRYSDLRKFMYDPPGTFRFRGFGKSFGVGLGLDNLPGFTSFHPVSSLVDKSRGMPDDLALEPRDCLSLWKTMTKFQTDKYKVPESLNPAKALPSCIRKADIFTWEKSLKKVLLQWMTDGDSPFDKVVSYLTPTEAPESDEVPSSTSSSITDGDTVDSFDLKSTTLPLLFQLHKRRALPAILFNYDRSNCEEIADAVLKQLVDAETKWKEGPAWKKMVEGYEKYQEMKEKKSKKPIKPSKKTNKDDEEGGGSKTDRMRDEADGGSSVYDLFDPMAPQADFSFANPKQLQKAELEEFIRQLRRKNIREELIELLKRGIGIHHAGMNQMLFRKRYLRVVIATGTLALGINMPCATVVFTGDSVFLTALNFRQAAGRAGRRGFDLLGNVVFQGISRERACRLLSSRLPELTGHFPITTTLVLRLFSLLNDSKSSPYAVKAINSLLSQPRLYLGGQSFKEQVLHHLRFSIEYLRRNDLLGPAGQPVNFTSCVSHLYYTENSSFTFHALLKGGYFHKICADIDTKTDEVLLELILVLSHIFGRRICREVDDEEEKEKIKRSPSIVYLPALPEDAADILRDHNKKTLEIFTSYVKTFAAQHIKEEDRYLPLTKTPIGVAPLEKWNGQTDKTSNRHTNGSAHTNGDKVQPPFDFLPNLPVPHARSPFVALSGLGDDFRTIEDLCSSTRDGVFLESAVIPHLELHPEETKAPLNAYLYDFYMHGAVVPLEVANGIRKSDVWFALNDFSMVLATVATSLALYLGLGNDSDPEMLDIMGTGDVAENEEDEKDAAAIIPETPSATKTATPQQPIVRKSKKVVDDWGAGEDALVAEEDALKSAVLNGISATDDEEYDKLMNVYKAFRKLKTEFDAKFMAIWA